MRFDPYSFDTKYSDAMLNFLSGQVGEEMSSKRDIEKTLMLEKLKQDRLITEEEYQKKRAEIMKEPW